MQSILIFLFLISILALVHELGHFAAAKLSGVKVEEFGIGFPPRLWSVKKGETVYSLNVLPIGGFVRLLGEEGDSDDPCAFCRQGFGKKAIMLLAGVITNLLLGLLLFFLVFSNSGLPRAHLGLRIEEILPETVASASTLELGDGVIGLARAGEPFEMVAEVDQFPEFLQRNLGQRVGFLVLSESGSEGGNKIVMATLPDQEIEGKGVLGVQYRPYPYISYQPLAVSQVPGEAVRHSWDMIKTIVPNIRDLFLRLFTARPSPEAVAGPVGIARVSGKIFEEGWSAFLYFAGALSVSLAAFNVLPLPVLDGGRLVLAAVEFLVGRRIEARMQQWINTAGFVFLFVLMIWVTVWDVIRIF